MRLVIDMVNDYFRDNRLHDQNPAVTESINDLTRWFRRMELLIIWIRQEFSSELSDTFPEMRREGIRITIAGTQGAMLLDELDRSPNDHELIP